MWFSGNGGLDLYYTVKENEGVKLNETDSRMEQVRCASGGRNWIYQKFWIE